MQQPFSIRLSALTFLIIAFSFQLLAFSSSCSFNPDRQKPGVDYLQGEWQQDSVSVQKKLISYTLYHLKFSCDSFFVKMDNFTKVNTGADSCMRTGRWTEYSKGTYRQRNDTLFLKGQFANADGGLKDDKGCFHSGDYAEIFKVTKKTNSLIRFASTSNVIPIDAHLTKRESCHPKSL